MMEFLATNFNLPTIIVGAIVFGGVGWATWHSHKHGGCGGCGEGGCNGNCGGCSGCSACRTEGNKKKPLGAGRTSNRPAPFFRMKKVSFG